MVKDALRSKGAACTALELAASLAELAAVVRAGVAGCLEADSQRGWLAGLYHSQQRWMGDNHGVAQFADMFAQTAACGLVAARLMRQRNIRTAILLRWIAKANPWLGELLNGIFSTGKQSRFDDGASTIADMARLVRRADMEAVLRDFHDRAPGEDFLVHFYELFLRNYDPQARRQRGVFFTPRPLVSFVVRGVEECLRENFGLEAGLADVATWSEMARRHPGLKLPTDVTPEEPFLQLLDPAMGTGTFLVEVIERIHQTLSEQWLAEGHNAAARRRLWNRYVPRHLLTRLHGLEVLTAPWVMAQLKIAQKLAETGYTFSSPQPLRIYRTNTLQPLQQLAPKQLPYADAERVKMTAPITVILGNPPYRGNSSNRSGWIDGLLQGKLPDGNRGGSYYEADGRPLGEKKLWLKDDYVKFIRYGQWKIESAGCGLLAYVSNHGYLDNPTFRGMRQRLLETFPQITVIDLHGNQKKKERSSDGSTDQSVFLAAQGVAVGLMVRPVASGSATIVRHGELWGRRQSKYQALQHGTVSELASRRIEPGSPFYFFSPHDEAHRDEYQSGHLLTEIMPVNTTAPVTARDRLVVAFDEQELIERMRVFRDRGVPDAEIRAQYFTRARSPKYPPGDTRGWKLGKARTRMAADVQWRRPVESCLYRPFDRRSIYWTDWMIDWPRTEVMRHMRAGLNLALITRRQMLPSRPCDYFWIADRIVLDGVIRSDNRGSESVFPLYLLPSDEHRPAVSRTSGPGAASEATVNFKKCFLEEAARIWGLRWIGPGRGDGQVTFGAEDLLHYLYATFHSTIYRTRYAEFLRTDFPRVFLARDVQLFRSLRELGADLTALHLMQVNGRSQKDINQSKPTGCNTWAFAAEKTGAHGTRMLQDKRSMGEHASSPVVFHGTKPFEVLGGFPKFDRGKVYINASCRFEHVPQEVWDFHVGGHQICRKWLRDRRGRVLSSRHIDHYRAMVTALDQTIRLMDRIDRTIQYRGGWPHAFVCRNGNDEMVPV